MCIRDSPISIPGMYEIGSGLFLEKRVDDPIVKKFEPGKLLLRVRSKTVNANISKIDQLMNQAIAESAWPGAVLLAAKDGNIFYQKGHGYHTYQGKNITRSSDIFDLASITKTVATTSSIMKLKDLGKIDINKPCLLYTSPSPRDVSTSRMPSSA